MVVDAGVGGGAGLVEVDAGDGAAGRGGVGAADGVVEDDDAVGAGDVGEDRLFDFRVVLCFHGIIGCKVFFCGGGGGECGEGVGVESEVRFFAAEIAYGDVVVNVGEVALGLTGWWRFDVVEGCRAIGWRIEEVEFRGHLAAWDVAAIVVGSDGRVRLGLCVGCCCGCCHCGVECVMNCGCNWVKCTRGFGEELRGDERCGRYG